MDIEQNSCSFTEQMDRIQIVTGHCTQTELAAFLGIRQSAISTAKRRQKIPSSWLVILMRLRNVHPEWILTGNGPCFVPVPTGHYETATEAAERLADAKALRRLSSHVLAEELVRRIAAAQDRAYCTNLEV